MRTGLYPFLTFANISFFCGFIFIPTLCGFAEKTSNNPHNFFGIIPAPAEIKILERNEKNYKKKTSRHRW